MEVFLGFMMVFSMFMWFISFVTTFVGINIILEGFQQFFVPFEAKDDEDHPRHKWASWLYRDQYMGYFVRGRWVERKRHPCLHTLMGVVISIISGALCFLFGWLFFKITGVI